MAQREIETPEKDEEISAVAGESVDDTAVDTTAVAEAEAIANGAAPAAEEE